MKIDNFKAQNINLSNHILFKSNHIEKKISVDTFSYLDKFVQECNNKKLIKDLKKYFSIKKESLNESEIMGLAGRGGLSTVFKLAGERVLKCTLENPLEYRTHCADFDIPFLSEVEKVGEHYFVIEPQAKTKGVTNEDCKDVIKRIYKAGYEPSIDLGEHTLRQVGIFEGKPYLLDTRAALPQPNKFSKFIYDFCDSNQRVFRPKLIDINDISAGCGHVDETPRKNLGFIEGIKKAFGIIKENMEHGYIDAFEESELKFYVIVKSIIQKLKTTCSYNLKK